jgi:hypothetical protein
MNAHEFCLQLQAVINAAVRIGRLEGALAAVPSGNPAADVLDEQLRSERRTLAAVRATLDAVMSK